MLTTASLLCITTTVMAGDNYFLCNTSKGTASLSLSSNGDELVYKMSNSHGGDFEYSSNSPGYTGFSYNHYSRFQTDYFNVSFNTEGFKYVIFSNYEDGDSSRGIMVVNLKNKKEYKYKCKNEGVDKLSDLTNKLQCDKNDALGCQ